MRSTDRPSDAGPDPLDGASATRARIRDAAVLRFARDGFTVGLRQIAEDAGVTAPLIVHYFGSKDGLRAACDTHVLAMIREAKGKALVPNDTNALLMSLASVEESAPLVGYALRSLQAGGRLARDFVDQFAADAEVYIAEAVAAGEMRPSRDEKARARYLTVQGLGALLLDVTLNPPAEPTDLLAMIHGYMQRMALPTVEIFTDGLLTNRRMLDAYLLYVGDPPPGGDGSETPQS